MSRENVQIVEMLLEKFKAGDHDVFEHYDPEIEWDATRGGDHVSDVASLYHGHDGVRAYWAAWLAAWQSRLTNSITSSGTRGIAWSGSMGVPLRPE
jgi:hypothetical protein